MLIGIFTFDIFNPCDRQYNATHISATVKKKALGYSYRLIYVTGNGLSFYILCRSHVKISTHPLN